MSAQKNTFFVKSSAIWTGFAAVALFLAAEGLLIGLISLPSCDSTNQPEATTESSSTQGPTSAPTKQPWDYERLPTSLTPLHYDVTIQPDFSMVNESYWFYGTSSAHFRCENATNYIILHSVNIKYQSPPTIKQKDNLQSINVNNYFFNPVQSFMVIEMEEYCLEGAKIIGVSFMVKYGARKTFPCFDEINMKATFDITVIHPKDYIATANMPIIEEKLEADGFVTTSFQTTEIMSTYLLAITVTDFKYKEAYTNTGIQTRIYARSAEIENGNVDYAANIAPSILDNLAEYFKVPYPLPKSDQMCVPNYSPGAMEHWGLVIYRETRLLYNENITSPFDWYSLTTTIAHELTHQWFGNLATPIWWDSIWLKEGFASYFEYYGTQSVQPDWKVKEWFVLFDLQVSLYFDDSSDSHPLYDPEGRYDSIPYSKGACFNRMVEGILGKDTYMAALTNYLNNFAYKSVSYGDVLSEYVKQASADGLVFPFPLYNILESWIVQMGFPLVTVERISPNEIQLSQNIFLIDPSDTQPDQDSVYNYQWYIPLPTKQSRMET